MASCLSLARVSGSEPGLREELVKLKCWSTALQTALPPARQLPLHMNAPLCWIHPIIQSVHSLRLRDMIQKATAAIWYRKILSNFGWKWSSSVYEPICPFKLSRVQTQVCARAFARSVWWICYCYSFNWDYYCFSLSLAPSDTLYPHTQQIPEDVLWWYLWHQDVYSKSFMSCRL